MYEAHEVNEVNEVHEVYAVHDVQELLEVLKFDRGAPVSLRPGEAWAPAGQDIVSQGKTLVLVYFPTAYYRLGMLLSNLTYMYSILYTLLYVHSILLPAGYLLLPTACCLGYLVSSPKPCCLMPNNTYWVLPTT